MSTLGDIMSTSGDIMSTSGGYHEYIGDIMSTSGDVQYIMRCSVHQGDSMSTSGGYHEYVGGCSVHEEVIIQILVRFCQALQKTVLLFIFEIR